MAIKMYSRFLGFFILIALLGCPPADCTFVTRTAVIPNLVKIEPQKTIYNIGDVIIYSAEIPSQVDNFGTTNQRINLFEETKVSNTILEGSEIHTFNSNSIELVEGATELINNTLVAKLKYYPDSKMYKFKAKITLSKSGNYILNGVNLLRAYFDNKKEYCIEYVIDTNIEGANERGRIEFVVE